MQIKQSKMGFTKIQATMNNMLKKPLKLEGSVVK